MSSLIVSSMPSHHNMKLLQVVHRRGFKAKMANPLGITGENVVADHLEQVLRGDPHVATRIKAVGGYGPKDPPDLDVVVYSPGKLLLVMEVKWHIAVSNTFEAVRKEDEARRGRCRLDKLRHKIACGKTTVKWPELWDEDDANSCEWRWFVLTHDTIPVHNLGDSDIKIRSYLLLKHLLKPGSSTRDLVDLLEAPPVPAVGEPLWETVQYGDVTMEWQNSEIPHSGQPESFKNLEPDRRGLSNPNNGRRIGAVDAGGSRQRVCCG